MVRECLQQFGPNLFSVIIHGSAVRRRLGQFSDVDVLIVCGQLTKRLFRRDMLAQSLKQRLLDSERPFSFDFCTVSELKRGIRDGHPFLCSILDMGVGVYRTKQFDLRGMKSVHKRASNGFEETAENLLTRASWHLKMATILSGHGEHCACLFHSNFVFQNCARAYLLRCGKNVFKGEILQLFLREVEKKLDDRLRDVVWKIAFPLNQAFCRMIDPSIDIPIRSFTTSVRSQLRYLPAAKVIASARQFLEFVARYEYDIR